MSLLGSIGSFLSGAVKSVASSVVGGGIGAAIGSAIPGVGTVLGGTIGSSLGGMGGGGGRVPPSLPSLSSGGSGPLLPMITGLSSTGKALAGAAVGAAAEYVYNKKGQLVKKRKRRRKGISGHDLQSFKRVARLIDKFAAPVHHLRKSSFKHKTH